MSVLAPERPATEGIDLLAPSPVAALEDLDRELEFLFESVGPYASCCATSVTSNGSACCASKTLSVDLCCQAPA